MAAAQLAIDDCLAAECKGMKIELVSADNQNKADVGAAKAREWFDRDGVTAIADLTNSAVALAVQGIAREKNKVVMFSGPATTALTNKECSPVGFHWMFDTYCSPPAAPRRPCGPAASRGTSLPWIMPSATRWKRTRPRQ